MLFIIPVYGDTNNSTDGKIDSSLVINKLANFEINLNQCQQNVTNNCKQVENKLDEIKEDLNSLKTTISDHDSGSNTQWINALNMSLAAVLLSLSITALIVTKNNRDKKNTEGNIKSSLDEIKTMILNNKTSTDENIKHIVQTLKELSEKSPSHTTELIDIVTDLKDILKGTNNILKSNNSSSIEKKFQQLNKSINNLDENMSILHEYIAELNQEIQKLRDDLSKDNFGLGRSFRRRSS